VIGSGARTTRRFFLGRAHSTRGPSVGMPTVMSMIREWVRHRSVVSRRTSGCAVLSSIELMIMSLPPNTGR